MLQAVSPTLYSISKASTVNTATQKRINEGSKWTMRNSTLAFFASGSYFTILKKF